MSPRILIKFPSRTRPKKFFDCLENIKALIGIEDYIIAAALDLDDDSMNNPDVKNLLKKYDNLIVYWGISGTKIKAINRSIPMHFGWKYLLVTSDDMVYIKKDFGNDIIKAFNDYPDAGLIHFPDQRQKGRLITLPLMTRIYFEQFGYVYHPSYISVKADMEQMEVAKRLGKYQFVPVHLVEHRHPRWGFQTDEQYKAQDNQNMYAVDGATFAKREALNFDL